MLSTAVERAPGVVVIARNEGERLRRCLQSVLATAQRIVYVDSGSTDGSVEFARSLGPRVEVVDLDMSRPFSMPRARNAGFERLRELEPTVELVQFVDGDCEVLPGWIDAAAAFLRDRPDVAAVCGRRLERFPDASIYNRLCHMEWNTPVGETRACGGDVLLRVEALRQVRGYRDELIAGEEPELCVRLRAAGWKIHRLDRDMTLHDAAMTRFRQFWKRSLRSGHAYAEGAYLHGRTDGHCVRELVSAVVWGGVAPSVFVASVALAPVTAWALVPAALVLAGFGKVLARAYRDRRSRGDARRHSALYAAFCLVSKFSEICGAVVFWSNLLRGRRTALIEYKDSASPAVESADSSATREDITARAE